MDVLVRIRNEAEADYRRVEEITRQAFWNIYIPGCIEHYLVHVMRTHEDFVPELDLVIEVNGQVVGSILYTKAALIDESGREKKILTFGPVSILPEYQRMGYGKRLMEQSFQMAVSLGYDVIVIFGDPGNYVNRGFKSCKKYNVCIDDGTFPTAMLVKELTDGALGGKKWIYRQSPVFHIDKKSEETSREIRCFDETFERMEKKYQPSQESFYILSNSVLR